MLTIERICVSINSSINEGDIMENTTTTNVNETPTATTPTKFCKHCGSKIPVDAVLCTFCGRQVEELGSGASNNQPNIVINNSNANSNVNTVNAGSRGREKNKWVAILLCVFLGFVGGHKFYEGKAGMGILYLFTGGLFGIGVLIDFITLLCKPNPYYV